MEDNIAPKKQPNLPSNYVTLAQLQERWIKEQQMKQKKKEQREEQNQKKLHNEEAEAEHLSQPIRRNSDWKSCHRNLIGTNVKESKAVSVAVLEENEKSKELNRKGRNRKKKKNKGEARAQEEDGKVGGSEAHALLVKSEKKNVGYERQREMRVEYRAKVEKVVEENNQTVEIEKEIGDLSIDKESEKSNRQNKISNGRMRNREYRNYYGYANRADRNHRGYNDGGDRGNGKHREGYGRFNGRYGGGHGRFNGDGQRNWRDNGKIWVKKEEVANGGHVVGNQSSSGSFE